MRDITSLEYREIFAATQQLPTAAIPTMLPTLNKLLRDEGGGEGLAPSRIPLSGDEYQPVSVEVLRYPVRSTSSLDRER